MSTTSFSICFFFCTLFTMNYYYLVSTTFQQIIINMLIGGLESNCDRVYFRQHYRAKILFREIF